MPFPQNIKYLSRNCVHFGRLGFALHCFTFVFFTEFSGNLNWNQRLGFWFHFHQIIKCVFWMENDINPGKLEVRSFESIFLIKNGLYLYVYLNLYVIVWQLVFDYDAEFLTAMAHWHVLLGFLYYITNPTIITTDHKYIWNYLTKSDWNLHFCQNYKIG